MSTSYLQNGDWNEVVSHVREKWSEIASDELENIRGNVQQLIDLIQRRTGVARDEVERELRHWISFGHDVMNRTAHAVHDAAQRAGDAVHLGYDRVSDSMKTGYRDAEGVVRRRPAESVAVAFGSGLIAGVLLSVLLKSR